MFKIFFFSSSAQHLILTLNGVGATIHLLQMKQCPQAQIAHTAHTVANTHTHSVFAFSDNNP